MKKNQVNHEGNVLFGGCDTVALAKEYGTPLYVVDEGYILDRCKEVKEKFLNKYPNTRAVFASKANQTLEICRIIAKEGLGFDVVSGGELYVALKAGVDPAAIIFHGNNKTPEEIEMAVKNNVGRMVVDNEYELNLIDEIAEKAGKVMKVMYRITPGVDSHTHKFISTGHLDSKFGIPLEREHRDDLILKAIRKKHVDLMGFHFHVGSQLLENTSHLAAVGILLNLMQEVKRDFGFDTKELNLGGGFGISYVEGEERQPLEYFTDAMMMQITDYCNEHKMQMPKVIIEPGRWVVGEAGVTLYTVGSIKEVPKIRRYMAVDGGMPDNPRPALYEAKYEAVIANKGNKACEEIVTVAGKCCESGDILIWDLEVPEVESGDILCVFCTGAYNHSMASNYNRLPRPAMVMVKDGKHHLCVRRETYEDLIAREI